MASPGTSLKVSPSRPHSLPSPRKPSPAGYQNPVGVDCDSVVPQRLRIVCSFGAESNLILPHLLPPKSGPSTTGGGGRPRTVGRILAVLPTSLASCHSSYYVRALSAAALPSAIAIPPRSCLISALGPQQAVRGACFHQTDASSTSHDCKLIRWGSVRRDHRLPGSEAITLNRKRHL
jgi:hypothetical protein